MSPIKADAKLFENNEGNQTEGQIWAEGKADSEPRWLSQRDTILNYLSRAGKRN